MQLNGFLRENLQREPIKKILPKKETTNDMLKKFISKSLDMLQELSNWVYGWIPEDS